MDDETRAMMEKTESILNAAIEEMGEKETMRRLFQVLESDGWSIERSPDHIVATRGDSRLTVDLVT